MRQTQVETDNQNPLIVKPSQFYQHDPVMIALIGRLHITTVKAVTGIALVALIIQIGVSYLYPTDLDAKTNLAPAAIACHINVDQALEAHTFWKDFGAGLLQGGIIIPLGMLLYFVMPGMLAEMFNSLVTNNAIDFGPSTNIETKEKYADFLEKTKGAINSPFWVALGLACVVIYWAFRLNLSCDYSSLLPTYPGWQTLNRFLLLIIYSPALYGSGVTIGRLGAGLFYTGYLFEHFDLKINPLHQDQAGGLGLVGRNLIRGILFSVILGCAAVVLVSTQAVLNPGTTSRPEPLVLGIVYLVLTPIFFYCWLWIPHQALLRARMRALQPVAVSFQNAYLSPHPLEITGPEAIKARTEQMMEINRQSDFILDIFPTWPLPNKSVKNLIATASLPPLSSIVMVILTTLFPGMPDVFAKLLGLVNK